ncbi:hypothetical protein B0H66DRAFT_77801 [Apodospora peruviana]|uniref:Uncharacterized protein n=1 Tax=Apodospora peruviana TaxID=516989 RepID=A0AAE0MGI8_9PEZI|nr:hypothetical protein B0H66DRAFT_77801 [Apodospora peruviana]
MDKVLSHCNNCHSTIGQFMNLWTQIGKSYFSPVVEPNSDLEVDCQGTVRLGETGTLVEGCSLQDIVCANCATILGLKCIETPVNHVLHDNQFLLRHTYMQLTDDDDNDVEFVIQRVLDVREAPKVHTGGHETPNRGFAETVDLFQIQSDLQIQRENVNRIDSNGFMVVSSLDNRVSYIEDEASKLKGIVGNLRRDINDAQQGLISVKIEVNSVKQLAKDRAPLAELEKRLDSVASLLGEVRQEVSTMAGKFRQEMAEVRLELSQTQQNIETIKSHSKETVSSREYEKDMAALRAELAQLRRHMDNVRFKRTEPVDTPFPSRELDILTSSIAKIGNRASKVETLQMEFDILKGRVERVEANRRPPVVREPTDTTDTLDLPSYADAAQPLGRKRDSSGIGVAPGPDPAPKRQAFTSYSDHPAQPFDSSPDWLRPPGNEFTPSTPKLTKTGKVDKRYQRAGRSLNKGPQ